MTTTTLLLILLAGIVALAVAIFQYFFPKSKKFTKIKGIMAFLRFIAFFGILVLLINPKFTSVTYQIEKPSLKLLIDNSSSIANLDATADLQTVVSRIEESELKSKFNIETYLFDNQVLLTDTFDSKGKQTSISKALSTIDEIDDKNSAVVLLTDGNQTYGTDYEFLGSQLSTSVYPVVLGDTTAIEDIKIDRVNVNKYAFLKNKYPVEIFVSYNGKQTVSKQLTIKSGNSTLYQERVSLSPKQNAITLNAIISAAKVGVQKLSISIGTLTDEKNTVNNNRRLAVEVIDEKTSIAIVSDVLHPDLGMLKKTIEANEQREATIISPKLLTEEKMEAYQMFILYQPNVTFRAVFEILKAQELNSFVITGTKTDWNFLNKVQESFSAEITNQTEEIQPSLNTNYTTFIIDDGLDFSGFPPLEATFGEKIVYKPHHILLRQFIKGIEIDEPLLATFDEYKGKSAILFGEHIWKWRMQNYLDAANFDAFDTFLGKLIFMVSATKKRDRLNVVGEPFYYQNGSIFIKAEYFDNTFNFDANATVNIRLKKEDKTLSFPMLLKNSYYEVDLSTLEKGDYSYTISVLDENVSKSGNFSILDFDVENQFYTANYAKLNSLAIHTNGQVFLPSSTDSLIRVLTNEKRFTPIQQSKEKVVPLIDFKLLLGLIVLALALEWFIRKYNGLT